MNTTDDSDEDESEDRYLTRCQRCHGSGIVTISEDEDGNPVDEYDIICPSCDGYGRYD